MAVSKILEMEGVGTWRLVHPSIMELRQNVLIMSRVEARVQRVGQPFQVLS